MRSSLTEWAFFHSPLPDASPSEFAVSLPGSPAAVTPPGADPIILDVFPVEENDRWPYIMDSSAHRIVSDLSELISLPPETLISSTANGASTGQSVTGQCSPGCGAGVLAPHGRQADPWPEELPKDLNVPTYHSTRQSPLDFVFASSKCKVLSTHLTSGAPATTAVLRTGSSSVSIERPLVPLLLLNQRRHSAMFHSSLSQPLIRTPLRASR